MVTLAWTLDDPRTELTEALEFGSLLLTIITDGFIGMEVSAAYLEFSAGGVFMLQVTMPHATDKGEAWGNADVVFRYLTAELMPKELVGATLLAWDQNQMAQLESSEGRASLLTSMEVAPREALKGLSPSERHWAITPRHLKDVAGAALSGKPVVIQSRPTRPLPPKYWQ